MKKIFELKEINKSLAKRIKEQKVIVKNTQREGKYAGIEQVNSIQLSGQYRWNHIAYCLLRGRLYEQIEKPKKENELSEVAWKQIEKIKEAYHEEDVCAGS